MGCGENLLAKEIPNKVYAFDMVACEEKVTACDISNVPLKDGAVDVVVFSLSAYNMSTQRKTYGNPTKVKPSEDLSATYQFRLWSQRGVKVHGSHLGDIPL